MTDRPTLFLRPGGDKRLRQGHPWAYSNEITLDEAAKGYGTPLPGVGFKPSARDDKYQLRGARWREVFMTPAQRTAVNARVGRGQPVTDLLSPRQIAALGL